MLCVKNIVAYLAISTCLYVSRANPTPEPAEINIKVDGSGLVDAGKAAVEAAKNAKNYAWEKMQEAKEATKAAGNYALEKIKQGGNAAIDVAKDATDAVTKVAKDVGNLALETLKEGSNSVVEAAKNTEDAVVGAVKDAGNYALEKMREGGNAVIDAANDLGSYAWDKMKGMVTVEGHVTHGE